MSISKTSNTSAIDSNITLCLACSSSLPPRSQAIFMTQCCQKPICSSCISANPRLARYNPCISCLGGVEAVAASSGLHLGLEKVNIDGAVRDEDTFVLGDDEEDVEILEGEGAPPPPYCDHTSSSSSTSTLTPTEASTPAVQVEKTKTPKSPSEYYIKRGDTLHGIALRFGIDGRELCRLNKLPPSTLSTTPHLLHTRTVLTLPPSARTVDSNGTSLFSSKLSDAEAEARAVRRARERAEKRLQTVTKEVDWRVAKAYVALAEDEDPEVYNVKRKEMDSGTKSKTTPGGPSSSLDLMALDRYLEDDEWEASERAAGRSM